MSRTAILIDDDTDDLDFLKEAIALIDPGISCFSFIYSDEAVNLLSSELLILPDFIFVDINMPKKNGYEVLRELRQIKALDDVPIIMSSTNMPASEGRAVISKGASLAMQKPASLREYKRILAPILGSKLEKL